MLNAALHGARAALLFRLVGMTDTSTDPALLAAALRRMGLIADGERPAFDSLAGGVSSDIFRVEAARGTFCIKRALPRLRVAQPWSAPVERSRSEVAWIALAGRIRPGSVPRLLGADPASGLFAMEYLDPARYPNWKALLRDGVIDPATAISVAALLVDIHRATAHNPGVARDFANDDIFHAIRIEPYLLATAIACPDAGAALRAIADALAATKIALVHGDASPKNILCGPEGPLLLDAECAVFGDPAFDLAFCLSHLLLKCMWRPAWRARYLTAFDALAARYLAGVAWEAADVLAARAARLLAAFLLARIDGKSPVEYIVSTDDRDRVRRFAMRHLGARDLTLDSLRAGWALESTP